MNERTVGEIWVDAVREADTPGAPVTAGTVNAEPGFPVWTREPVPIGSRVGRLRR
jgi:hypothetical protein